MKTIFLNKTLLLFAAFGAALCLLPFNVSAQWTDNGTSTTTNHNVVIGTGSPIGKLHVAAGSVEGLRITSDHGNTHLPYHSNNWADGWSFLSGKGLIFRTDGNNERMRITQTGNVGIGTTYPFGKLDINAGSTEGLRITSDHGNTHLPYHSNNWADGWSFLSGKGLIFRTAGNNERMRITEDGNVGIGTTYPGTFKLAVNGTIRAKEIVVEEGWSDYVFYDDYQLPTIEEEEKHIEENGHLLGFESEENMAGEIQLGDVAKRQQAKIEEMMLHLIGMNKQLAKMQTKIEHLEKENARLKK